MTKEEDFLNQEDKDILNLKTLSISETDIEMYLKNTPSSLQANYLEHFKDRWKTLVKAMVQPTVYACMLNAYSHPPLYDFLGQRLNWLSIPCFLSAQEDKRFPHPTRTVNGLFGYYPLDPASLLPVEALKISQQDGHILDVCAAPGGKSVSITQNCFLSRTNNLSLVCNEVNPNRANRLSQVIKSHVSSDNKFVRVTVTRHDATRSGCFERNFYDKILVDAPCSSDRHHMQAGEEIPFNATSIVHRQRTLLANAVAWLKVGGRLVYSTCTVNPKENDQVVAFVIKKCKDFRLVVKRAEFEVGEKTSLGWIVLPDTCSFGPMYFAIIEKMEK